MVGMKMNSVKNYSFRTRDRNLLGFDLAAGVGTKFGDLVFWREDIFEHCFQLRLGALLGEIIRGLRFGHDFFVQGVKALLRCNLLFEKSALVQLDRITAAARFDFFLRAVMAGV